MRVEIIAIGTELLNCSVSETNAHFLMKELKKLGYPVHSLTVVRDDESDLEAIFTDAFIRSDMVITSGGLGSTHDDLTKRYVAKVFNRQLTLNNEILEDIKQKYERSNLEMPASVQKQALMPRRAIVIDNKYGTAPGFICNENERLVISLPGVSKELEQMWSDEVRPFIVERFGSNNQEVTLLARTFGLSEIQLSDILTPFFEQSGLKWTIMAKEEGVDFEISLDPSWNAAYEYNVAKLKKDIDKLLGSGLYVWGEISMEELVGKLLKQKGLTVAIAESCTGGLVSHRLTQVPGSSHYFGRGVVTYSNQSKEELLGVKAVTLQEYGAVSSQAAREMAIGARKMAGADLGLSTTGIAGPDGGSIQKPVGLVYCALSSVKECSCQSFRFMGNRNAIKMKSSQAVLNMLRLYLEGKQVR